MVWRWIINRPHQTVPPAGSAMNVRWRRQRLTILTNSSNTFYVQGYHDIVNEKIASAIAKLEEAGLTPEACEKFLKTYGKVIFKTDLSQMMQCSSSPSFTGSPPQPCPHAGHQVLLPEHPGSQRRVRDKL